MGNLISRLKIKDIKPREVFRPAIYRYVSEVYDGKPDSRKGRYHLDDFFFSRSGVTHCGRRQGNRIGPNLVANEELAVDDAAHGYRR